ncbi:chemotaxis protein MotA [Constrictibacter sp. MBR-5]
MATAPASASADAPLSLPRIGLRTGFDTATVLGIASGFLLVGAAVVLGGSSVAFLDAASFLIVVGGTLGVSIASYSWTEVGAARRVLVRTLRRPAIAPRDAALLVLGVADNARRRGVLALQPLLPQLRRFPFLVNGLGLILDGLGIGEVETSLRQEIEATTARHATGAAFMRKAAEVAPAMGLIGTLVGLVQMLGRLEDPTSIGPAMAVALLTTLYGAVLANMLFAPLATKLERNATEEALVSQIYLTGLVSILRQENPRRLELQLNTLLPPAQRLNVFN